VGLARDDRGRRDASRRWDLGFPKAHRAKLPVDSLVDVMRSPARDVLEESDASDPAIVAEIKPVFHAAWDVDHVATLDRDAKDWAVVRVQVEDPFAFDRKANLVLRVGVLFVEFREHPIEVRGARIDVDDIGGQEPACSFDLFNLWGVFGQDVCIRGGRVQSACDLPVFVPDPKGLEERGDFLGVGDAAVLGWDVYGGHVRFGSFV